jgi:hypothetical protein
MNNQSLQITPNISEKAHRLRSEFEKMKAELFDAEAALAKEQAAVNAFRMYCRLTIGNWVETLLDLRTDKQSLLTQLNLLQQEQGRDTGEPQMQEEGRENEENGRIHDPDDIDPYSLVNDYEAIANNRRAEKQLYRELARRFHPDLSVNTLERAHRTTIMTAINVAYQSHDLQILRDLAGEQDPATVIEVDLGETAEIRQLQKKIAACRRRQRKVNQQLKLLRQENIAKLWRQAQQIEPNHEENWWQDVQQSLQKEIDRLRVDIVNLNAQIGLLAQMAEEDGAF